MTSYIHGQLEPAPNPKLVKGAAQMILDDLLRRAHQLADLAIGKPLPDQIRHLNFLWGQALARHHDFASVLSNAAVASRTRLRPSRIPARRNSVRRCCFTVRGLMWSWPAISLLLQPCTNRFKTCWSRGVTLTCCRSITDVPPADYWRSSSCSASARLSP